LRQLRPLLSEQKRKSRNAIYLVRRAAVFSATGVHRGSASRETSYNKRKRKTEQNPAAAPSNPASLTKPDRVHSYEVFGTKGAQQRNKSWSTTESDTQPGLPLSKIHTRNRKLEDKAESKHSKSQGTAGRRTIRGKGDDLQREVKKIRSKLVAAGGMLVLR